MISMLFPQNATSFFINNSFRIKSNAWTNLSNVQPSLNIFNSKNATTLVDIIGVDLDESESDYNGHQIIKFIKN